jgi:hypothetical protein
LLAVPGAIAAIKSIIEHIKTDDKEKIVIKSKSGGIAEVSVNDVRRLESERAR